MANSNLRLQELSEVVRGLPSVRSNCLDGRRWVRSTVASYQGLSESGILGFEVLHVPRRDFFILRASHNSCRLWPVTTWAMAQYTMQAGFISMEYMHLVSQIVMSSEKQGKTQALCHVLAAVLV